MKKQISVGYFSTAWQYVFIALISVVLTGCAGQEAQQQENMISIGGISYPATPPRVIQPNPESDILIWDNIDNFSLVPANLQATGDAECQSIGGTRAVGYHPLAQDLQGNTDEAGGYLCR